MESDGQYIESEHVNTPATCPTADAAPTPAPASASTLYPTIDAAASPYPAAASVPEPTPYPSTAPQQHPSPLPYPQPAQQYPPTAGQAQFGYGQPPGGCVVQPGPQYVAALPPQQMVLVSVGQPIVQYAASYIGHIIFACTVLWFCNLLFGLIAFILAGQYILFTTIRR